MDYQKFPSYFFAPASHPFRFIQSADRSLDTLPLMVNKKRKTLTEILEQSETTAFLVIKNDSIRYENYFNGYTRESINTTFSVAKSITSLMVGIALDEGKLSSLNDPITTYLTELRKMDTQYDKVTINSLLNMRSGIQFKDHDMPWGDKPKAYYHPHLRERIMELPVVFEPGSKFQYNSYNPIVAGMILEKITGRPAAMYFEEKIWNKLGMEFPGSWSMDSEESGMTKMESGINLRAVDFAKLGRLVLNKGNWNGNQIVSEKWMEESCTVLRENHVPEFGEEIHYEKFWWLFSKDHERAYIISGWGHLGQFLYVFPESQTIIVRMGKDIGNVESWKKIFVTVENHIKN